MRRKRQWTIEEDRILLAQSQGKYSIHKIERMIRASRESMWRRADELGIELKVHPRKKVPNRYLINMDRNPCHVGKDKLLARLQKEHGDRSALGPLWD